MLDLNARPHDNHALEAKALQLRRLATIRENAVYSKWLKLHATPWKMKDISPRPTIGVKAVDHAMS